MRPSVPWPVRPGGLYLYHPIRIAVAAFGEPVDFGRIYRNSTEHHYVSDNLQEGAVALYRQLAPELYHHGRTAPAPMNPREVERALASYLYRAQASQRILERDLGGRHTAEEAYPIALRFERLLALEEVATKLTPLTYAHQTYIAELTHFLRTKDRGQEKLVELFHPLLSARDAYFSSQSIAHAQAFISEAYGALEGGPLRGVYLTRCEEPHGEERRRYHGSLLSSIETMTLFQEVQEHHAHE